MCYSKKDVCLQEVGDSEVCGKTPRGTNDDEVGIRLERDKIRYRLRSVAHPEIVQ